MTEPVLGTTTLAPASTPEHMLADASRPFGDHSANSPRQLDLFEWAALRPTARIYDWCGPFAAKVMARIYEYDDAWPKQRFDASVTYLPHRRRA